MTASPKRVVRPIEQQCATSGMTDRESKIRMCAARDAFNRRRQMAAELRRGKLAQLLRDADMSERGWQSRLAEQLGVDRATVHRDLSKIAGIARKCKVKAADEDHDRQMEFRTRLEESILGCGIHEADPMSSDDQRATKADALAKLKRAKQRRDQSRRGAS